MSDPLELDQSDLYQRILADEELAEVSVLLQRKGVTESDVDTALETFNERAGKIGAVAIVLMPALAPESPDLPGPAARVRATVQIVENPLFNLGDTGTGRSAESIATRIRRIVHHFANGTGGTWYFDGQDPLPVDAPKLSYAVHFRRQGGDAQLPKVARPTISIADGLATLACATPGASLLYSTDGAYPATAYSVPFAVAAGVTIRAAASLTAYQQSDVACATA